MGKTVFHITKFKGNTGGLGHHIDRKQTPKNVDKNRTHLNIDLIKPGGTLQEDIQARILKGKTSKRKIRTDAVKYIGIISSGSHDQMKEIENKGDLLNCANDSFEYVAKTFGKENIIRASLHMDEKTPHIHFGIVPITSDGRLSAKVFLDGKSKLREMQTDYSEKMAKYGLERGVSNEKRKHVTTSQYYKYINQNDITAESLLKHENAKDLVAKTIELADNNTGLKHNEIHIQNERRLSEETRERELREKRKKRTIEKDRDIKQELGEKRISREKKDRGFSI